MNNKNLLGLLLFGSIFSVPLHSNASVIETADNDIVVLDNNQDTRDSKVLKLPQTRHFYTWLDNDWSLTEMTTVKWNKFNLESDEVHANYENNEFIDYTHNVYEYDDDGRITSNLLQSRYEETDPWTNQYLYTFKYDDIDPSFISQKDCFRWNWMMDDWENAIGYGYFYEIYRDDANRVRQIIEYESIQSTIILESITFEYIDETGPAANILVERADEYYDLVPYEYYDNIRWEKSDCNYLHFKDSRYYRWTVDPNNKMKTANLYTYDEYGDSKFNSRLDYVYDDKGRTRTSSIYSADGVHVMNAYEYDVTPTGGYKYYLFNWEDQNRSKNYDKGEEILGHNAECVTHDFDSNGYEILIEAKNYNEKTGLFDKPKYKEVSDVEYLDGSTIKQVVYTCYNKQQEISKKEKYVYDNFIDGVPTSIKSADTEDNIKVCDGYLTAPADSRYIISDLQGRIIKSGVSSSSRIIFNDLPSGIYVINVGGKTVKVMR